MQYLAAKGNGSQVVICLQTDIATSFRSEAVINWTVLYTCFVIHLFFHFILSSLPLMIVYLRYVKKYCDWNPKRFYSHWWATGCIDMQFCLVSFGARLDWRCIFIQSKKVRKIKSADWVPFMSLVVPTKRIEKKTTWVIEIIFIKTRLSDQGKERLRKKMSPPT